MFQRLLREETIFVKLDAPNREAALAEMVALLPSWSLNAHQKCEALDLLLQRERFGTTAVGEGVALPRCTMPGIESPIVALGIYPRGVQYPSLDGEPVQLVFLSVFPEDLSDYNRQRIIHSAEWILKDRFLRERLKICQTPEEAFEFILRESNILSESLPLAGNQ
jgi:mannitol/fructose-specific phosphotransferase system IIA component (Ntr-type)